MLGIKLPKRPIVARVILYTDGGPVTYWLDSKDTKDLMAIAEKRSVAWFKTFGENVGVIDFSRYGSWHIGSYRLPFLLWFMKWRKMM